jgi:hypothetical protein
MKGCLCPPSCTEWRVVKKAIVILAAFCVAFTMAVTASAAVKTDYVTRGLLCIHHYEGSWTDPGAPFWGGLQMDLSFQIAYGYSFYKRWGTADHWPRWAQLQAGRNGYRARGWTPWPNTARYCGLLR